jgi:hypothetical protein
MKITKDTRINALLFNLLDKEIILYTDNQNMTLGQYIDLSFMPFLQSGGKMPNPNQILDCDFKVEDVFLEPETGHTFTTLVSKTNRGVCSVIKLDLVESE